MKKMQSVLLAAAMVFSLSAGIAEYTPGTYTGTAQGHLGPVSVEVTLSENAIEDITVTETSETHGIGDVASDKIIAQVLANQSLNVDSVTGCTLSAAAFRMAITNALESAGADVAALRAVPKAEEAAAETTIDTDVVVVGSGAAGLMAAYEAAQAGSRVVILEKLSRTGGSTRTSSGMIVAGGTSLQAAAGIEDSVDALKAYWVERGEGIADQEMTDYVAEHINECLDLFISMGVSYSTDWILQSGTATVNRAHMPAGAGVDLTDHLVDALKEMGVEILTDTKAESLIQAEDGSVTGVKATSGSKAITVNAGAVVLATGGFAWNSDMLAQNSPKASGAWAVSSPGSTGDGILMAMDAGADTVFKGGFIGWKVCSPAYGHTTAIGAPIYGAANLIVNAKGDRFADESVDYPFLYNAMEDDGSDKFYFIFETGASETKDLVNNVSSTVPNLELGVAAGVCFKGDTLEELAQASGLTDLAATVEAYNAAIDAGKDEQFGRNTATMTAIKSGPFYALQCIRATLGTFGGINTNITGEVVDKNGTAIAGLYAAGECANGEFFPTVYPASGSSLSMCVVLGREAGASAAAYAAK